MICDVDHYKIKALTMVLINDGIHWTDYSNDHEVMIMASSPGGGNFIGIPPTVTIMMMIMASMVTIMR